MIIEATKKENLVPTLAKDESLQREEKPLFFYHSNFSTPYKRFTWPAWQQFLIDLMNHSRNQQRTDQRVLVQCTLVIVNAWIVNNLSLVNIFGETGRFFYNINYMLNSEHLSLVNKIGDKTEFTITRVHCSKIFFQYLKWFFSWLGCRSKYFIFMLKSQL